MLVKVALFSLFLVTISAHAQPKAKSVEGVWRAIEMVCDGDTANFMPRGSSAIMDMKNGHAVVVVSTDPCTTTAVGSYELTKTTIISRNTQVKETGRDCSGERTIELSLSDYHFNDGKLVTLDENREQCGDRKSVTTYERVQ